MSRTIRKEKPSKHSWNREYAKYFKNPNYDSVYVDGKWCYIYRESTKEELNFHRKYSTGDGNHRVKPHWWYRHQDIVKIRSRSKQELNKYKHNPEHEIIIPNKNLYDVWWSWS